MVCNWKDFNDSIYFCKRFYIYYSLQIFTKINFHGNPKLYIKKAHIGLENFTKINFYEIPK